MAGVGVVIGFVSLAFVFSFVGAYFFSSFIDCLTRPSEERHRVHFESLQKMKEDVKKRVLDALFPAKVRILLPNAGLYMSTQQLFHAYIA